MGCLGMVRGKVHQGMIIRDSDIVEKFIRSTGPGGQNINKVSTCVYLRHLPTGIEVKCQQERSQALNRRLGRQILIKKIKDSVFGRLSQERSRIEKIRRQKRKTPKKIRLKILEEKRRHSEKKKLRKDMRLVGLEALLIFTLFSMVSLGGPRQYCFGNEDSRQVKIIEGNIVDIDWVAQKIVVRWLQTQGQVTFDEITIFVPDGTKITKGSDTISLSDLNMTDPVTVEYYNDSPGPLKAKSINVKL